MKRKVRNLRVKCEHDFIRFHRYFPQCRVPTIDIGLFRGGQSPLLLEIKLCLFWFPRKIQKGRWIFIESSENYHMWISRDFWGAEASRIPAFLFSKGCWLSAPDVILFLDKMVNTILSCAYRAGRQRRREMYWLRFLAAMPLTAWQRSRKTVFNRFMKN